MDLDAATAAAADAAAAARCVHSLNVTSGQIVIPFFYYRNQKACTIDSSTSGFSQTVIIGLKIHMLT